MENVLEYINIKRKLLDKGYGDIRSVPKEEALSFIDKEERVRRYINSNIFNIGDNVVFDNFKKEGMINGSGGGVYTIFGKDKIVHSIHGDSVFLKSDMLEFGHWNTMSETGRFLLLKACDVRLDFTKTDWSSIPFEVKKKIRKMATPSGYEGGSEGEFNTQKPGSFNPVSSNKPLSERLSEAQDEKKD